MGDGVRLRNARTRAVDRRGARRYKLNWLVKVIPEDSAGERAQFAILRNLSSTGALAYLKSCPQPGQRVLVFFKLPVEEEIWMRYSAAVVRVSAEVEGASVAFKFDNSRPDFEKAKENQANSACSR